MNRSLAICPSPPGRYDRGQVGGRSGSDHCKAISTPPTGCSSYRWQGVGHECCNVGDVVKIRANLSSSFCRVRKLGSRSPKRDQKNDSR